jgi:sterol desaturase/sphingolipid hydroxylase (fatty acid hydroxylase superfamily)
METLVAYFSHIPPAHRTFIIVGGLTFFWLIESAVPLFKMNYRKWPHAGTNLFFTFTTILVNFCMAFLLLRGLDWANSVGFGILNWLPQLPLWASVLVGMLLLDLIGAYAIHWTEHKVQWMWRFHLVHHTDTHLDTTSANRHHPGESVFRFAFTVVGAVLVGAPMWLVMMYQACSVVLSQFNHANIGLPGWLDRPLSWVFVTPDMHHVHHHYVQPYTDCNYGNIFSVWDHLFGTFMRLDREKLVYGIDTYPDPKENAEIGSLLKIPFQAYRTPVGSKFSDKGDRINN